MDSVEIPWEAFRMTSRAPSELLVTLSPAGVDNLLRQALNDCWNELPVEDRDLQRFTAHAREVFDRNLRVWSAIRKPSPEQFFKDLLPHKADGHLRQAMVLCWMMLPRGHRDVQKDVRKIVEHLFARNLAAWEEDHRTFTSGRAPKAKPARAKRAAPKRPGAKRGRDRGTKR